MVGFVNFPIERLPDKFHGIYRRLNLGAKLLDRFSHRRRQFTPPINGLTYRFFDRFKHFLYCDFAVGSGHDTDALFFQQIGRKAK